MKKKKLKAEIKYLNSLLLESSEQCLRLEDEFLLRLQTEQSILDHRAVRFQRARVPGWRSSL